LKNTNNEKDNLISELNIKNNDLGSSIQVGQEKIKDLEKNNETLQSDNNSKDEEITKEREQNSEKDKELNLLKEGVKDKDLEKERFEAKIGELQIS